MTGHTWGRAVLGGGVLAVVFATLVPVDAQTSEPAFACVFCGERFLADVLVNVILYLPVGIGLALTGVRPTHILLGGALLSATIETVQVLLPGRDASIGDVIANTIGTGLGGVVASAASGLLRPNVRLARRLAFGASAAACGTWWLTGYLLAPSFPQTVYYGGWTPNMGHIEWYRGRVLTAMVGGNEIQTGPVEDSEGLRHHLLGGEAIMVQFIAGPATSRVSSIFSINDEYEDEIVLVGPDGEDLVFRYRARAADWRLDQRDLRWRNALRGTVAGDTLTLRASIVRNGSPVALERSTWHQSGYGVGDGWTLLFYAESMPVWLQAMLDGGWIAGLLFPIGLWIRRDGLSVAAIGMAVVGLALVPVVTVLTTTSLQEWLLAATGLVLGVAMGRVVARNRGAPR
jgi:hypothetical protein